MEIIGKQELKFENDDTPDLFDIIEGSNHILVGHTDGQIKVFKQIHNGKYQKIQDLKTEENIIKFICIVPQLKTIMLGSQRNSSYAYEISKEDGTLVPKGLDMISQVDKSAFETMICDPETNRIFAGFFYGCSVCLDYNSETQEFEKNQFLTREENDVTKFYFGKKSKLLFQIYGDRVIRIRFPDKDGQYQLMQVFKGSNIEVSDLCTDEDTQRLFITDGTRIQIWKFDDVKSNKFQKEMTIKNKKDCYPNNVLYVESHKLLISGFRNGDIVFWRFFENGKQAYRKIKMLKFPEYCISGLKYDRRRDVLVSSGYDYDTDQVEVRIFHLRFENKND